MVMLRTALAFVQALVEQQAARGYNNSIQFWYILNLTRHLRIPLRSENLARRTPITEHRIEQHPRAMAKRSHKRELDEKTRVAQPRRLDFALTILLCTPRRRSHRNANFGYLGLIADEYRELRANI